jgi:hypothetical protein
VPVSLSAGKHIETGEFALNLNTEYEIQIEAGNKLPVNTVSCMLGLGPNWPNKTCGGPSVLRLSWVLLGNRRVVEQGSSDQTVGMGGWTNTTARRTVGYFRGQKGTRYALRVDVLGDGSSLAATDPHLRVNTTGRSLELELMIGAMLQVLCTFLAALGVVVLLVSIIHQNRTRKAPQVAML